MRCFLWVIVSLQAWATWCGVVVSPDTVDFGRLPLGQYQSRTVIVQNTGTSELTILHVEVRQWTWGGFAVRAFTPQTLAPGLGATVEVTAHFRHNLACGALLLFRLRCSEAEWTYVCLLRADVTDPDTVYAATDGLWGEALRERLRELVQTQRVFSYDSARRHIFLTVDNRAGTVECVYTGQSIRVPPMPSASVFNVEHTWPRSRGTDTLPPLSDLHHLFPTLAEANERRGNLPYGVVRTALWQLGGSRYGLDSAGAEVFEPRDQHKGDAARALFYVALRYGNMTGFLSPSHEALLRRWHWQDTVEEWERMRTQRVARLQGAANPVVERPRLVERLYRIGSSADFPAVPQLAISDTLLEYRGDALQWRLDLALLNTGWGTAQVRSVDLLTAPDGIVLEYVAVDSLIPPGGIGRVHVGLAARGAVGGDARLRIRFAAGVRPVDVILRWKPHTNFLPGTVPQAVTTEEVLLEWNTPLTRQSPQLMVYSVLGRAADMGHYTEAAPNGVVRARIPRRLLPRGLLLFRLVVGQRTLWTWRLNP
ncbi:MAG: endonuclease [Candidatus Kapabacteria bacterium]|nr:endonuclease [Candidatus Kapabacteria bacterium]MCS7169221.1 endonuclease [Candidatus Kapabacteria bacterium]MDW7996250.1 endonuclease [Bacteroidota bacterium]MDW8226004.1 endonuclease [Bacteroidota bacterium]